MIIFLIVLKLLNFYYSSKNLLRIKFEITEQNRFRDNHLNLKVNRQGNEAPPLTMVVMSVAWRKGSGTLALSEYCY